MGSGGGGGAVCRNFNLGDFYQSISVADEEQE